MLFRYQIERRIFQELLDLKRLQIRAGRANESVLVKRLADEYTREDDDHKDDVERERERERETEREKERERQRKRESERERERERERRIERERERE
jgi:hypothetical protein